MNKLLKTITLPILFVFTLSSCATSAKYEQAVSSWIGSPEKALIQSWGVPNSVYQLSENEKILTYFSSRNVVLPGTEPTYTTNFIGNTAYTNSYGGTPASNLTLQCKTTFTIEDKVVMSYSFEGNDCVST